MKNRGYYIEENFQDDGEVDFRMLVLFQVWKEGDQFRLEQVRSFK